MRDEACSARWRGRLLAALAGCCAAAAPAQQPARDGCSLRGLPRRRTATRRFRRHPSIAGQPKVFIENQLVLIREGLRDVPEMKEIVAGMSDETIIALASTSPRRRQCAKPGAVQPGQGPPWGRDGAAGVVRHLPLARLRRPETGAAPGRPGRGLSRCIDEAVSRQPRAGARHDHGRDASWPERCGLGESGALPRHVQAVSHEWSSHDRRRNLTRTLLGIIVKENTSSVDGESGAREMSKFRHSIEATILISSIARWRPGQKRGPAPNGRNACVLWPSAAVPRCLEPAFRAK